MKTPHIFVGTMYSGEGDLPYCISALQSQEGITFEHIVIVNKRELDAHRELYASWNIAKSTGRFDVFLQLDADTVLWNNGTLRCMYDELEFAKKTGHTSVQSPLVDFFTGGSIMGLNMYSCDVVWNEPNDEIYCDRSTSNNRMWFTTFGYAGKHAWLTTPQQAFHFGLHRGLKNRQAQREEVLQALQGDDEPSSVMRAFAILGFDASHKFMTNKRTSYSDHEFSEAFVQACRDLPEFMARNLST